LALDKRKRRDVLAEAGVTAPESALLCAVHYGITNPPSDLPRSAAGEVYSLRGPTTVEECRSALAGCLAKGWLRVIDDAALWEITEELHDGGVLGPVYGLPRVGGVDFTRAGAALWQRLRSQLSSGDGHSPFPYTDVVHSKTAWYFPSRAAALAEIADICDGWAVDSVAGPTLIGRWRAQWWRRYPEGYRIDIERRTHWEGWCGEGEGWSLPHSPRWRSDTKRLQHVLACHNVDLAEWLLLAAMDCFAHQSPSSLPRHVAAAAEKNYGVATSMRECRAGLEACLANGWLRAVDREAVTEVRAILRDDPATDHLPGEMVGGLGEVDFTPVGAALYRMIAAEFLGPDWDAGLRVWKEHYREEHGYCEAEGPLQGVVQDCVARGETVLNSRIVPLGPWSVYWWKRFPHGYRLELQIGRPGSDAG
jgi:hypothetical protein